MQLTTHHNTPPTLRKTNSADLSTQKDTKRVSIMPKKAVDARKFACMSVNYSIIGN